MSRTTSAKVGYNGETWEGDGHGAKEAAMAWACMYMLGTHMREGHMSMGIWTWMPIVAWVYGFGLTWEINSYAWVQRALTTWVQASYF